MMIGMGLLMAGAAIVTVGKAQASSARAQTVADVVATSAGRHLLDLLPTIAADPDRSRATWRRSLRAEAALLADRNGARLVALRYPDPRRWPPAQLQVEVEVTGPMGLEIPAGARVAITPGSGGTPEGWSPGGGGQYEGPLVHRDGKPMCPAVAVAFDRMDAAARNEGVKLVVTSAFRSDVEQAVLFRNHPDPKWVAPPGRSRHRYSTELDISSANAAWPWLAENARRFGFVQRYSWEPWHYGYLPGCGATPDVDTGGPPTGAVSIPAGDGDLLPAWVPVQYRSLIMTSAERGGVPPIVLAALLKAESNFDPYAVSPVGAQGIAQLMPATARGMGLANPFDPSQAIPAAGRLLGGHLRRFGSIPLALAAYNAGPGAVQRSGGVPPFSETQAYVTRIMALAGDPTLSGAFGAGVRLVRQGDALA
jgi:hypothetical protein